MKQQMFKARLVGALMILQILGVGLAQANPPAPNTFTAATTDLSAIKGDGELAVLSNVELFTSDAGNNVFISTGLDLDLAAENPEIPNPENYTSGPGLLLQAKSGNVGPNGGNLDFEAPLVTLLADNNLFGPVMDSAGVKFEFTAPVGHDLLSVDFILLSQEFHTGDWDIAAIFINGTNYAYLPDRPYLRVNGSVGITNICLNGDSGGCISSAYDVNGMTDVGSITQKLTLFAPITPNEVNTFMASVANTQDNLYPTALHLSNFQTFQGVGAVTFGIDFVVEEDEIPTPEEAAPLPSFVFLNIPEDKTSKTRINKEGNQLLCSAGKYQFGLPGDFIDVTFKNVTYRLLVDGNVIESITADSSSASWDISQLTTKGLATCSISMSFGGSTLVDHSDGNRNVFNTASTTRASQKLSASFVHSKKIQDALAALAQARTEIRSTFEVQRLTLNSAYDKATQELKVALESGKITPKQYTTSIKAANADYREKLSVLSGSYKSALAENSQGSTTATSQNESQLLEALKAIDATYAQTLEEAGYGVVLD